MCNSYFCNSEDLVFFNFHEPPRPGHSRNDPDTVQYAICIDVECNLPVPLWVDWLVYVHNV